VDHERCAVCGFDGVSYDDQGLVEALRALGPSWRALLTSCGPMLRRRPDPDVWSAIEYAAHSRDITALHAFGVDQALTEDEPVFPRIDADALIEAASAMYNDEDPAVVAAELGAQADRLATLAEAAGTATWSRGLTIGDDRSDVRRLLEHALHDSVHHLGDVKAGLLRLGEGPGPGARKPDGG